jgi:pseudoazurin
MKIPFLALILISSFAHAKTVEVKMLNTGKEGSMVFEPAFVKVAVGDTVKFVPTDKSHNSSSVFVPAGAKPWTGKPDQAVSVKLTKEGIYIYKCDPHSVMAMVGVVQVGKAVNLADAQTESNKISATFALNKDRLKKYLGQAK